MKKGDRFRPVGFTADGDSVIERELDDGAKVYSRVIQREAAEARDDLPETAELIEAERVGGDEYRVTRAEPYNGPSWASNRAYRSGWDTVFGEPKRDTEIN